MPHGKLVFKVAAHGFILVEAGASQHGCRQESFLGNLFRTELLIIGGECDSSSFGRSNDGEFVSNKVGNDSKSIVPPKSLNGAE